MFEVQHKIVNKDRLYKNTKYFLLCTNQYLYYKYIHYAQFESLDHTKFSLRDIDL